MRWASGLAQGRMAVNTPPQKQCVRNFVPGAVRLGACLSCCGKKLSLPLSLWGRAASSGCGVGSSALPSAAAVEVY